MYISVYTYTYIYMYAHTLCVPLLLLPASGFLLAQLPDLLARCSGDLKGCVSSQDDRPEAAALGAVARSSRSYILKHTCTYVCMYICIYVFMYIHTYIHMHIHT